MTTQELLDAVRAKVETIHTSRDVAKTFRRHVGAQPFREAAGSGYDGFAVSLGRWIFGEGFGLSGQRQVEAIVLVEIGHAPFASSEGRENAAALDAERVADVLERHGWGNEVEAAFLDEPPVLDKGNNLWWVTSIPMRFTIWGSVSTP